MLDRCAAVPRPTPVPTPASIKRAAGVPLPEVTENCPVIIHFPAGNDTDVILEFVVSFDDIPLEDPVALIVSPPTPITAHAVLLTHLSMM